MRSTHKKLQPNMHPYGAQAWLGEPRRASYGPCCCTLSLPSPVAAYGVNYVVAHMRQPAAQSVLPACPQRMHWSEPIVPAASIGNGVLRWARIAPPRRVRLRRDNSMRSRRPSRRRWGAWSGVAGSALTPNALAPLTRTAAENACAADGSQGAICLNQSDPAFATGCWPFCVESPTSSVSRLWHASPPSSCGADSRCRREAAPGGRNGHFRDACGAVGQSPRPPPRVGRLRMRSGTPLASGIRRWRARDSLRFCRHIPGRAAHGAPLGAQLSDDDLAPPCARSIPIHPMRCMSDRSAGHILPANLLILSGGPAGSRVGFSARR